MTKIPKELIEIMADFLHDQWRHWLQDLIPLGNPVGVYTTTMEFKTHEERMKEMETQEPSHYQLTFTNEQYEDWQRLAFSKYGLLTEKEKDNNREWAEKILKKLDERGYL